MPTTGLPHVSLRVAPHVRQAWKAAADRDELDLSDWIRKVCNQAAHLTPGGHAKVPTSDAPRITGAEVARASCLHPREQWMSKGYATLCGSCGERVR